MSKTKIYASQISNLSDARYFSAMGATYLGFEIEDRESISRMAEISAWIEGPEIAAEIIGNQADHALLKALLENEVHTLVTSYDFEEIIVPGINQIRKLPFSKLNDHFGEELIVQLEGETEIEKLHGLSNLLNTEKWWLDFGIFQSEMIRFIENNPPYGLVLRGGEEERTGIKSFEVLDKIFEVLED